MEKKALFYLKYIVILTLLSSFFTGCKKDHNYPPDKPDFVFYALSDNNQILQLNAGNASTALNTVSVTGLQNGEKLLSIDFRPATGQLYGLGSTSRLYVLNQNTGAARAIGNAAFTPAINGTSATIDFNPTVDRIRLVSNTGQNLRLNPETGAVISTDGSINGVLNASISEVSYTNSKAGAASTVLFDLDATTDKLYKQDPPNDGKLVEVGSLHINFTGIAGFDISPDNSIVLAALSVNNATGLYAINLSNGNATFYDHFPAGVKVAGLAIPTEPVAYAVDTDNNLLIFDPTSTNQQPISKLITGTQAGEKIIGIDMRPVNSQLFGLTNAGRLYTFNLSSGIATVVGSTPIMLSGTEFGFDFHPTVDRIRVVSNTGQNIRLNPNNGTLEATDLPILSGTGSITAAAYAINISGAPPIVLYELDTKNSRLVMHEPPNFGFLLDIGPLGVNATGENGFDVGLTSGTAYAILTVGSAVGIYNVHLRTGAATKIADFPKSVQGLAVGLGF